MLPKRILFRLSAPCYYRRTLWTPQGLNLEPEYRLPSFGELEGQPEASDVRAAWSDEGLAFAFHVRGKRQPPWCRTSRPEDSDGVQLWIDTRDVHNVHRASRFCHRFLFMPSGSGKRLDEPWAQWMPINRAREQPAAFPTGQMKVRSEVTPGGYRMEIFLAAKALTGYEPGEHPRLGFQYAVIDRELGEETFAVGGPMPYQEDPSLWATLELVRE
jgi:hypothetical protein